jgi:transcription elongation factor Elf1
MAEKVKSKTDVAARAESKNRAYNCRFCGNKVDVVMAVSPSGKKKIKRVCCGL